MDLLFQALRGRFYRPRHQLVAFDEERNRLKSIFKSLVCDRESGSLLIIGRRGSGKKHLLSQSLKEAKVNSYIEENLLEVHLNGLIHTDDRSALKAMAKQLNREYLLSEDPDASGDALDDAKSRPFSQQLQWFLDGIRAGNDATKSLLIVLHEFDLFALHRNQILLYNLFDCCQSSDTPICVIGITCRLDIMELLEKRVKSRFSHLQIHLDSVAAPIDQTSSYADENEDEPDTRSPAFDNFCAVCKTLLTVSLEEVLSASRKPISPCERRSVELCLPGWNSHIADLMNNEIVIDTLRQAWSVSVSIRRLMNLLVPIVSKLNSDKTRIEPVEFIDSLCYLRQDAKVNSLKGLCILELFLIASFVKLQDIHDGKSVNFELLYSEYAKFCRANCPGYLYEKPVVSKLLDGLIDLELVVCGKEALAASVSAGRTRNAPAILSTLPNYKPLFCFVDSEILSDCLDAYPNCPVELKFWVRSRTF